MTELDITNPTAIPASQLAHLGAGADRDYVDYQIELDVLKHMATQQVIEHPAPIKPQRPERLERRPIDETRTFFVTGGDDKGGIRDTWNRWRLARVDEHTGLKMLTDGAPNAVEVIWSETKNSLGSVIATDSVLLQGNDAFNFLKSRGDSSASLFARKSVQA